MSNNKILIYTSNVDRTPRSMADVVKFAEEKPKYRLANVELSSISALRKAKAGDRIYTKNGNTVYVIKAFQAPLAELSADDKAYVEALYRKGMKNVNISGVRDMTPFEEWCRSAATKEALQEVGCVKSSNRLTKSKDSNMKTSIKDALLAKIKSQYLPVRIEEGIRLTINGEVAVVNPERDGYRVISSTGELTDYPEAMTLSGLPVFAISRPIADIAVGDVIESAGKFYKVTGKTGNKLSTICYTGSTRTKIGVKDALLGTTNFNVVVALNGGGVNGINPLMLAFIMGDGEFDIKDFVMMNALAGNNAALGTDLFKNPMMFLMLMDNKKGGDIDPMMFLLMGNGGALAGGQNGLFNNPLLMMTLLDKKGGKSDILETMLMAQAFGGGNGLGNLFGGVAPTVAPEAPAKPARRTKKAAAAEDAETQA